MHITSFIPGTESTPTIVDTSIDLSTKLNPVHQHHELSQPPIAVLPGAAESASSSPHLETRKESRPASLTHNALPPVLTTSSIGTFGSHSIPTHVQAPPATKVPPKPRPRPRPAYKMQLPANNDHISISAALNSSISDVTTIPRPVPTVDTIADTSTYTFNVDKGKRQEKRIMEEDIASYSLDIAERAKMRSRRKSSKSTVATPDDDIIELTSDSEDELSLLPPSRSKSKPSAKQKGKEKTASTSARISPKGKQIVHEIDPPGSTLATLPVPTSDPAPSSQLPPSDPPFPSSLNAPPSTPPQDLNRPSSPIPAPPTRKRKRTALILPDDEGAPENDHGTVVTPSSASLMPPPAPPAFFASSSPPGGVSSLCDDVQAGEKPAQAVPESKKKKGKKKVVNDEDDGWAEAPKSTSKPKGKKALSNDEESDWAEKPKPKPKPRPRAKKKKDATEDGGPNVPADPDPKAKKPAGRRKKMEVTVDVPSPVKRAGTPPPKPPSAIPEPDDSELSILESDLERGSKSSNNQRPSESEAGESSRPGKPTSASVSKTRGKGKKRAILSDDEGENDILIGSPPSKRKKGKTKDHLSDQETPSGQHDNSGGADKLPNSDGSEVCSCISCAFETID